MLQNQVDPEVIDDGLTITDADDDYLVKATVMVQAIERDGGAIVQHLTGDILDADLGNNTGIKKEYDTGTGVLSLTGMVAVEKYQNVLQTVSYKFDGEDPTDSRVTEQRLISMNIVDANSDEAGTQNVTLTWTINITSEEDAPRLIMKTTTIQYLEVSGARCCTAVVLAGWPS